MQSYNFFAPTYKKIQDTHENSTITGFIWNWSNYQLQHHNYRYFLVVRPHVIDLQLDLQLLELNEGQHDLQLRELNEGQLDLQLRELKCELTCELECELKCAVR